MKKWNKHDTKFILQSLAISCFAIFTWVQFHSYQINENYLDISLNHKEAKEEARRRRIADSFEDPRRANLVVDVGPA